MQCQKIVAVAVSYVDYIELFVRMSYNVIFLCGLPSLGCHLRNVILNYYCYYINI